MIEADVGAVRARSGGRCEWIHTWFDHSGKHEDRCIEEHLKPAQTYGGKVFLKVCQTGKLKDFRPESLIDLCWKHQCMLKPKTITHRPKEIDPEQTSLL